MMPLMLIWKTCYVFTCSCNMAGRSRLDNVSLSYCCISHVAADSYLLGVTFFDEFP